MYKYNYASTYSHPLRGKYLVYIAQLFSNINKSSYIYYYTLITMIARPCNESELRLLNSRVQICHGTRWGDICDDDWRDTNARVVCKELGFSQQG